MWNNRNSHSLLVGMQNGTATSEHSLAVSYKIKHTLTYPAIALGICLKESKTYVYTKTCTQSFFQGSENTLYDTIMILAIIHLSKPKECTRLRMNPDINYDEYATSM